MLFKKFHEGRALIQYIQERLPHYGPICLNEMKRFREEIIRVTICVAIVAAAGLIFVCFLSVAILLSSSPGAHQTMLAWLICSLWGLIAVIGLLSIRSATSGPPPFHQVGVALMRDYAGYVDALSESSSESEH
jgi:hypothetical protein